MGSGQLSGERSCDTAIKVKGRKRHIVVDTFGNLLEAVVLAAGIQDYGGPKLVLRLGQNCVCREEVGIGFVIRGPTQGRCREG